MAQIRIERLFPVLLLATLAAATSSAWSDPQPTRWALLVGVDQYDSPEITPLSYSVADVSSVRDALTRQMGFPDDQVYMLTGDVPRGPGRAESVNVIKKLDALGRLVGPEDTFLFYFSGHGFQKGEGQHFLATVNADPESLETLQLTTVPLSLLREKLKKIQARQAIFIIDACRTNPDKKGKGDGDNKQTAGFARDLKEVAGSTAGGQAGTAVLFACSEGQRSWEWDEKGHGAFTYYMLEGMSGEAAEGTGELTVNGLADYVQKKMRRWGKESDKVQTPDLEQYGAGKIVLADHVVGGHGGEVVAVDTLAHFHVTSDPPGASVFVDGQVIGTTPCTVDQDLGHLKTKQIEITVEAQGFRSFARTVSMERGTTADVDCPLERIPVIPVTPTAGATRINAIDGADMVYVPAGEFLMGSTEAEMEAAFVDASAHFTGVKKEWFTDQGPQWRVYLDAYWMYKNDVTVAQYRKFCQATGKEVATAPTWGWKDDHPVVNVSWDDAVAYCEWAGVHVPTEAQWEKAARGADGRKYTWGNEWDPGKLWCSVGEKRTSTTPVGSYPAGASPYGCLDMAGNVCNWCADWYGNYSNADNHNPQGPATGKFRVVRGGSWNGDSEPNFRCAYRGYDDPTHRGGLDGFRAVRAVRADVN